MNNQPLIDFSNKKIAVLGLGIEGLSSARFLVRRGAEVTVLDQKRENELTEVIGNKEIKKLGNQGVTFLLGSDYLKDLTKYDVIVRSPGIKRTAGPLIDAEKRGVVVTSHTKLFFDFCPCPIIGVTGTKGKGTTSALIYEMFKTGGFDVCLGGNIGIPPLDFLDKLNVHSRVVLELSSYQLQDLTKSPHIAVVLMVTKEHLAPDRGGMHENYHPSIEEYVLAKRNILRFQTPSDFAVVNKDYPSSKESDIHTEAKVLHVSTGGEVEEGCFVREGKIIVQSSKFPGLAPRSGAGKVQSSEIIDTKDILLPGRHNLENVCAAVMAALCAGVSISSIVSVLKTFKGLEHRLELVREVGGVRYYDDSFSTTPETAIAAIQAFTNPEILILGGAHKGSDFGDLGRVLKDAKNIKAVIGIGIEWPRIKLKVKSEKLKVVEGCKNMREIVKKASEIAQAGDVVLLSPACSSFGMFKNYKDRGEQFKKAVEKLQERDSLKELRGTVVSYKNPTEPIR